MVTRRAIARGAVDLGKDALAEAFERVSSFRSFIMH
jgi:hypothetical protein